MQMKSLSQNLRKMKVYAPLFSTKKSLKLDNSSPFNSLAKNCIILLDHYHKITFLVNALLVIINTKCHRLVQIRVIFQKTKFTLLNQFIII